MFCGGAAILVPAAAGIAAFLNPLRQKSQSGQFVRLASLNMLPIDGTPWRVPVIAKRTDAWNHYPPEPIGAVFLRRAGNEVTALQVLCPHAGCPIGYDERDKLFACPCHAKPRFDLSGKRVEGPESFSPRDMDALEAEVRNTDEVWVKFQTYAAGTTGKIALG